MKNTKILRYCCLIFVTIFILTISGCASHMTSHMALNEKMYTLDISKESIALMMLTATNQYIPHNWLAVRLIFIKEKSSGKKFRFNVLEVGAFKSFRLPPGEYTIYKILGEGQAFGGKSVFDVSCDINFYLEPNSVIYIGHIDMVNRKKRKGEKNQALS